MGSEIVQTAARCSPRERPQVFDVERTQVSKRIHSIHGDTHTPETQTQAQKREREKSFLRTFSFESKHSMIPTHQEQKT